VDGTGSGSCPVAADFVLSGVVLAAVGVYIPHGKQRGVSHIELLVEWREARLNTLVCDLLPSQTSGASLNLAAVS
jgi:hypothetical protein